MFGQGYLAAHILALHATDQITKTKWQKIVLHRLHGGAGRIAKMKHCWAEVKAHVNTRLWTQVSRSIDMISYS